MNKKIFAISIFILAYILIPVISTLLTTGYVGDMVSVSDEVVTGRRVELEYKNATKTVDVNKFVIMVLANMYQDSDHIELIKAESVIIRTNVCRAMGEDSVVKAKEVGIKYLSEQEMRSKWGKDFEEKYNLIADCVLATNPYVIKSNGQFIDARYMQVSAGKTMSGKDVLGEEYTYLNAVDCSEDISCEDYLCVSTFSNADFVKKLKAKYKDIVINSDNPAADVKIINKTEEGYVLKLQVGDVIIGGDLFCELLDINSSCMEIEALDKQVRITTKGKGNGFGVSLYSANIMAENGSGYEDILKKFYSEVSIEALE